MARPKNYVIRPESQGEFLMVSTPLPEVMPLSGIVEGSEFSRVKEGLNEKLAEHGWIENAPGGQVKPLKKITVEFLVDDDFMTHQA